MEKNKVYQEIVSVSCAKKACELSGNVEWMHNWCDRLSLIEKRYLPSGSGFDVTPVITKATRRQIIILGSFHCMDDAGGYDGWIDFSIKVTPDLGSGIYVRATAKGMRWPKKYAYLRDYIEECYTDALLVPLGEFDLK